MAVTCCSIFVKGEEDMADYNRSEAYDLSLYDLPAMRSSAAPRIDDRPVQKPAQAKPRQTAAQARKESVASALRTLKIFVVSATLLLLFGAVLFSKVSLIMLENEATRIEAKISEAKSENTRLVMQLNSDASLDKVDAYAVSVLGMNKLERYQIHYFGNDDADRVVIAGGRAVEDGANAGG
jgi:cell division protein FtsL